MPRTWVRVVQPVICDVWGRAGGARARVEGPSMLTPGLRPLRRPTIGSKACHLILLRPEMLVSFREGARGYGCKIACHPTPCVR